MQNQIADALATMTSMMDGPKEDEAQPIVVEQKEASLLHVNRRRRGNEWRR